MYNNRYKHHIKKPCGHLECFLLYCLLLTHFLYCILFINYQFGNHLMLFTTVYQTYTRDAINNNPLSLMKVDK